MRFEHPLTAAVAFGLFLILYVLWNLRKGGRHFGFSDVRFFPSRMPLSQILLIHLPTIIFMFISLTFFLALSRPMMKDPDRTERILARDIVLVIDMSYSMQMKLPNPERISYGRSEVRRKIDAAKEVAIDFISSRKKDRLGVMIFGDDSFGLWPMTTEHPIVAAKVAMLDTDDGYGFLGATNLVKAVETGIAYIEQDSEAKEPILIFISDGEGTVDEKDLNELVYRLRGRNIHFYWIQIERGTASKPSPIDNIVNQLEFGKKFSAGSKPEIEQAIAEIDRVEKTRTVLESSGEDFDIYPQLCLLAAVMVIGAVFLEGYRL